MRSRARPHCPECDAVVDPKRAKCITLRGSCLREGAPARRNLVGVYCGSDCAMDAWFRGFPYYRIVGETE